MLHTAYPMLPQVSVLLRLETASGVTTAQIGDLLYPVASPSNGDVFFCDVDAAREMALHTSFDWDIKLMSYMPEASTRVDGADRQLALRIVSICDLPVVRRVSQATEKDPEIRAALRVAEGPRPPRARRGHTTAKKRATRGKPEEKASVDQEQGDKLNIVRRTSNQNREGEGSGKLHEQSSSATDASDSWAASDDEGAGDCGVLGKDDRALWEEAAAKSAGAANKGDVPPPPPPAEPSEAAEPCMKPDGSVFLADAKLGRISYSYRSPVNPSMFLYCRRHQCYKSVSARKNPSEQGAARWLAWGASAECQSKEAHLAAFERMVCGAV